MSFYDRIKTDSATASGVGNITWSSAEAQHALPPAGISETVVYTVLDSGGTIWETGTATIIESGGTYTILRGGAQTVTAGSSGAGTPVSLSTSSVHTVFLAPHATMFTGLYPYFGTGTIDLSDLAGTQVGAFRNVVTTSVSGALTSADHSGCVLVTSGNVTVPNAAGDVGFSCVLIAGGAHTVTFNSTTSAAMSAGDLITIIVESTTVIHAVKTLDEDKVPFS